MGRSNIAVLAGLLLALVALWWLLPVSEEGDVPSERPPSAETETSSPEQSAAAPRRSAAPLQFGSQAPRRQRPAEDPSVWLRGHVTDWNGRPIPGARIVVRDAAATDDTDPFEAQLLLRERVLGGTVRNTSRVYAGAWTGDQGEYSISPSSLAPAVYQVSVECRGWAPQRKHWVWTGSSEEINFTIGPGVSIQGRILDAKGRGLQGASVQALTQGDEGRGNWAGQFELVSETASEADGVFLLDVYPGTFQLTARAQGYAPGNLKNIESGKTDVQLSLSPGCSLEGVVESPSGVPLPSADVRIWIGPMAHWSPETGPAQSTFSTPYDNTSTDAVGRFFFEDLAAGPATIVIQKAGHVPAIARVTVREGALGDGVRIRLRPGHSLAGRVQDRTRRPIPGALVAVLPTRSGTSRRNAGPSTREPIPVTRATAVTESDSGGYFQFDTLQTGSYQVSADADGFQPVGFSSVAVSRNTPFLTIEMEDGFTLAGRVRDSLTRREIPGATLLAGRIGHRHLAQTDSAGRYELTGLPEEEVDQIQIRADGYGLNVIQGIELVGQSTSLDIFLEAGAEVEGRIVDERGQPVSGAWVHIQPAVEESGLDVSDEEWERRRLIRSLRVSARSNGAGEFRLVGITPAPNLVLSVRHPLFQVSATTNLTLGSGQQLSGVEIVLDEPVP